MKKLLPLLLICALTTLTGLKSVAADQKPKTVPAEKGKVERPKFLPFHGSLEAVDKTAKTVKVGERTFQVTSETRITKTGKPPTPGDVKVGDPQSTYAPSRSKPATLDDVKVGEEVAGSYKQADGGRLELRSLRLGSKAPEVKPAKEEKKPAAS